VPDWPRVTELELTWVVVEVLVGVVVVVVVDVVVVDVVVVDVVVDVDVGVVDVVVVDVGGGVEPALVETMNPKEPVRSLPTAQQAVVVGHARPARGPTVFGTVSELHVLPPVVLAITSP